MKLGDDSAKKRAKQVTPKQEKIRTILNWVMTAVCIVLIVFALVVAIFTIVRSTNGLNLTAFGKSIYMNVASDSMEPTFSTNDIIIAKRYDGDGKDLKVGQVITFGFELDGRQSYNTHRIIYIAYDDDNNVDFIKTRGDKKGEDWKKSLASPDDVITRSSKGPDGTWDDWVVSISDSNSQTWSRYALVATWGSVDESGNFHNGKILKGVGAFANWIQDNEHGKTRFFCVIVLPLIILFIAYAFVLVRTLVIAKLENNKKVQGEPVRDVDSMSDEEKRRLAQELLASLGGGGSDAPQAPAEQGEDPAGQQSGSTDNAYPATEGKPGAEDEKPGADEPTISDEQKEAFEDDYKDLPVVAEDDPADTSAPLQTEGEHSTEDDPSDKTE